MNPPDLIIVDREAFTLRLYRMSVVRHRYRRAGTFKIAVGRVGFETPPGPYMVEAKTLTPDWRAPDWAAPEIAGQIIPFEDPRNPFAGGFISLGGHPSTNGDGVGIHGVRFDPELGSKASHGCIRMATEDLLRIYDRVLVGTPVFVL